MMSAYEIDWSELSLQWLITFSHFLWQACVVGLVLFVVQHAVESLRRHLHTRSRNMGNPVGCEESELPPATIHYAIACLAFFLLPIIVVATFAWVHQSRGSIVATASSLSPSEPATGSMPTMTDSGVSLMPPLATPTNAAIPITERSEQLTSEAIGSSQLPQIQAFAPYIVFAYAVGVAFMLMRFCLSIIGSSRLRRTIQPITDSILLKVIAEQAARLGLKRIPVVSICHRVSVPFVVGVLKPMILLPPTLLCGLNPQQVAAVLSHEMAHIRRYDLILNVMQRIVEALLFFHPVTWWISRRVSLEREKCCDDVVVACMGRLPYASALLQMAELCIGNDRRRSAALATLAASGSNTTDFGYRIRRLIGVEETTRVGLTRRSFSIGLALTSLMAVSVIALAGSNPLARFGSASALATSQIESMPNESSEPEVVQEGKVQTQAEAAVEPVAPEKKNAAKADDTGAVNGRITLDEAIPTFPKLRVPTPTTPRLGKQAPVTDEEKERFEELRAEIEASLVEIEDESLQFDADGGLANAFVYLAKAPSNWKPNKIVLNPAKVTMQDYHFEPRAVIIQTLQDMQLSNAGVAAENFRFNALNNAGQNRLVKAGDKFTFKAPFTSPEKRPIEAQSDISAWKRSFLLPLDHPFAAVTDKQGRFSIEGLPPGTHSFLIWHERTGWLEKSLAVNIQANQTTEVNRSYGINRFKLPVNPNKSLTVPTDVLWGESIGGMRLGIRRSQFARRGNILRHGEQLDYEVWIKNETNEVVHIGRDPRDLHRPGLKGDRVINVIGSGMWLSFGIPPEELAKSELILPPGHSARRFLEQNHSASIRPPGSPRGRFGSDPLLLEPGKYTVYAQVGDLKSGVEEVEIIPAARLQVRKSSQVTDKKREMAAADPSDAILSWQMGSGEKQEAMINWDHGVLIDERDLSSVEIVPVDGQADQYSIALKLRPESASWLSRRIASYSLWDDPDMVTILLDGKPLGAVHIISPIPKGKLIIPMGLPREQVEAIMKEIQAIPPIQKR